METLIKKGTFAVMISLLFAFAACKGENSESNTEEPVKIVGDSLSPTGSDGMGREIDTVQSIERQLDSVNNLPQ